MVKSVKHLIEKCERLSREIYKGLLILCNSLLACNLLPSQLLHGYTLQDNSPQFESNTIHIPSGSNVKGRIQMELLHDKHINQKVSVVYTSFKPGQKIVI